VRRWLDAAFGVFRRDAVIFFTYRTLVVSQILGMLFQLTIFYFISRLLQSKTFGTPERYFAFVVVGLAIMQVLIITLGLLPGQVRQELVAGTMERFMVSPFGAANGVFSMLLFPLISALVTSTILLLLAATVFGLTLSPTAPLAIPVGILGSIAFMPFALALVALVIAVKQATAGTQYVASGFAIVGGLYFPVRLLPGWLRWTSDVQPFTPAADLLRHLLVNTPEQYSVGSDLLKLGGFAIVLFPLALILLRRAVLFGQRRGTIIEY
jgi:ABC-2 type transport system permease protein